MYNLNMDIFSVAGSELVAQKKNDDYALRQFDLCGEPHGETFLLLDVQTARFLASDQIKLSKGKRSVLTDSRRHKCNKHLKLNIKERFENAFCDKVVKLVCKC